MPPTCNAVGRTLGGSHNRLLQTAKEKNVHPRSVRDRQGSKNNRPTELIFVERCLNLLKPGGRMGIVLPTAISTTLSLAWLRRWAEGHAKLLAVVSLPEETFRSSNATVKASLVFLRKFTGCGGRAVGSGVGAGPRNWMPGSTTSAT